ncbi:MAG TPA: DUF2497 domain-containing protein [Methylocystis sp.]|nr:DUF2497 domain-containing protein [Methylocystis sp.]
MNALNPQIAADRERRAAEPSMEEILASIRRIISDDDGAAAAATRRERRRLDDPPLEPAPAAPAPDEHDGAVFSPEPEHRSIEPFHEYESHPEYVAQDYAPHDYALQEHESEEDPPAEGADPLVSPDAAASVTAQFQALAASMVINDSGLLHEYAREMLRPMLKAWLDDNLPILVERLVRAEIERVARGGRR